MESTFASRDTPRLPIERIKTLLEELRARVAAAPDQPLALVSFTIAGVQEFLVAARTTRDVWNGSYLLSYLAFAATKRMLERVLSNLGASGSDLTAAFPYVLLPNVARQPLMQWAVGSSATGDLSIANFPNQVLVLVPGDRNAVEEIAKTGVEAVTKTWGEIADECRQQFAKHGLLPPVVEKQWAYQVAAHRVFELYWSGLEVPASAGAFASRFSAYDLRSPSPYGALIELAGKVLGARKMTRTLEQIGQQGWRCSLCGARAALADYDTYNSSRYPTRQDILIPRYPKLKSYWARVADCFEFRFRESERLCAVCTVRRLAPEHYFGPRFQRSGTTFDYRFPSTSTVATAQAVSRALDQARADRSVARALKDFDREVRAALEGTRIVPDARPVPLVTRRADGLDVGGFADLDGGWLYPDTYDPEALAREYGKTPKDMVPVARAGREALSALGRTLAGRAVTFAPGNYLGIIAVDGDKMGDWVSGVAVGEQFTLDWQNRLSGCLADFAAEVRRSLEEILPGRLVYGGGDDVLAFVPAERSLEALLLLHQAYQTCVAQPVGYPLTISMACMLARHNDPLSASIAKAQYLLKHEAKEKRGRDAFVFYRTTEAVVAGSKNRALQPLQAVYASMLSLARGDGHGLSSALVPALTRLAEGAAQWKGPGEALENLVRWQAYRHTTPAGATPEAREAYRDRIAEIVVELFRAVGCAIDVERAKGNAWAESADPFGELVAILSMLRFLSRA